MGNKIYSDGSLDGSLVVSIQLVMLYMYVDLSVIKLSCIVSYVPDIDFKLFEISLIYGS